MSVIQIKFTFQKVILTHTLALMLKTKLRNVAQHMLRVSLDWPYVIFERSESRKKEDGENFRDKLTNARNSL